MPISPENRRALEKLEKEIGPNFEDMPSDKLLRIAARNSFHSGRAIRDIRVMVTIATAVVLLIAARTFGFI